MKNILENRIFRFILSILVILSMYFLPTVLSLTVGELGVENKNVCNLIALIVYLFLLAVLYWKELKQEFITFKKNFKNSLGNGLKYWTIGLLIMLIANIIINYFIMDGSIAANEELNRKAILENPIWYTIISTAFLAPFLEEIIFRKSLDKIFKNNTWYYVVSGLLFGFAHVVADLSSVLNLLYLIPYGSLGYVFAVMDKKTNTTFTSIMIHALHNSLTLILLFIVL